MRGKKKTQHEKIALNLFSIIKEDKDVKKTYGTTIIVRVMDNDTLLKIIRSGYPDFVVEKIGELHKLTGRPLLEILAVYEDILSDDFTQDREQFPTREDRERYAMNVTWIDVQRGVL